MDPCPILQFRDYFDYFIMPHAQTFWILGCSINYSPSPRPQGGKSHLQTAMARTIHGSTRLPHPSNSSLEWHYPLVGGFNPSLDEETLQLPKKTRIFVCGASHPADTRAVLAESQARPLEMRKWWFQHVSALNNVNLIGNHTHSQTGWTYGIYFGKK